MRNDAKYTVETSTNLLPSLRLLVRGDRFAFAHVNEDSIEDSVCLVVADFDLGDISDEYTVTSRVDCMTD